MFCWNFEFLATFFYLRISEMLEPLIIFYKNFKRKCCSAKQTCTEVLPKNVNYHGKRHKNLYLWSARKKLFMALYTKFPRQYLKWKQKQNKWIKVSNFNHDTIKASIRYELSTVTSNYLQIRCEYDAEMTLTNKTKVLIDNLFNSFFILQHH